MAMATTKDEFFQQPLRMLHVTGWPAEAVRPGEPLQKPVVAPPGARLALWPADPAHQRQPDALGAQALLEGGPRARRPGASGWPA